MPPSEERLLSDPELLPSELRLGLERLRDKRPSTERVAAMAAAVAAMTAATSANAATANAGASPSPTLGALSSPAAKLALVAGVIGVGAAALFFLKPASPSKGPEAAAPAAVSQPETVRSPSSEAQSPAPARPAERRADARNVPPGETAPGALPAPDSAPPLAEPAASAASALAPPNPEPGPASTAVRPERRVPAAAAPGAPAATSVVPAAPAVTAARPSTPSSPHGGAAAKPTEAELLRDARQVLDRSPVVALSLCDEHQREYPRGGLTQERELIAIAALLRLGRTSSAEARAARFRAAYPRSPYLTRLDRLVPP